MNSIAHDRVAVANKTGAAAVHGDCGKSVSRSEQFMKAEPELEAGASRRTEGDNECGNHFDPGMLFGLVVTDNEMPESWVR